MTEETGDAELDLFVAELRELRKQAGQPSLRIMSRSAHYSHTALAGVLAGGKLPSLDLTLAFVRACRGDEQQWRRRWHQARIRMDAADTDSGAATASRPAGGRGRPWWQRRAGFAGLVAAAATGVSLIMMPSGPPGIRAPLAPTQLAVNCPARPDPKDRPLVPCDDGRFVADITIPDGTTVRAGHKFVKTWEIRNTGLVPWRGRFLQRQGILNGPGLCSSPSWVPVPTTMPGQDVKISVPFTAPSLPGSCRVDFKMTDKNGRLYFPFLGGVYVIVNITG